MNLAIPKRSIAFILGIFLWSGSQIPDYFYIDGGHNYGEEKKGVFLHNWDDQRVFMDEHFFIQSSANVFSDIGGFI